MPYSADELILAAHVRTICEALRDKELKMAEEVTVRRHKDEDAALRKRDHSSSDLTTLREAHGVEKASFRSTWQAVHPLKRYAPQALNELREIVDAMKATKHG